MTNSCRKATLGSAIRDNGMAESIAEGPGAHSDDMRRHLGGIPPCPGVGLYLTCKSDRLTVEANGTFFLILPLFEVI